MDIINALVRLLYDNFSGVNIETTAYAQFKNMHYINICIDGFKHYVSVTVDLDLLICGIDSSNSWDVDRISLTDPEFCDVFKRLVDHYLGRVKAST